MKKVMDFFKKLVDDKNIRYLVLNLVFGIIAITLFILQMCIGVDYTIGYVGWFFILCQCICLCFHSKEHKRIQNGK